MIIQATITGKNQITILAIVVRELQLEPGMRLEFELSGEWCRFAARGQVAEYEGMLETYRRLFNRILPVDEAIVLRAMALRQTAAARIWLWRVRQCGNKLFRPMPFLPPGASACLARRECRGKSPGRSATGRCPGMAAQS